MKSLQINILGYMWIKFNIPAASVLLFFPDAIPMGNFFFLTPKMGDNCKIWAWRSFQVDSLQPSEEIMNLLNVSFNI